MTKVASALAAASLLLAPPLHAGDEAADASGADATAADPAAGETLYAGVCRNCHGPTAKGMASFPKLAGRPADYLTERLVQYRSGEKVGPNTPLMAPHAADLSDRDIADLAAFIAALGE